MRQHTKGIACMLFSAASFSLMNVCVHMAGDLPAMQKSFFRNLIALGVSLSLILWKRTPLRIPKGQFRHLFSRSFFGTIGVVCNYYSVDHMLLSDATMLNKMSPFFSALFAVWILKEKITWVHVSFPGSGSCWLCIYLKTRSRRFVVAGCNRRIDGWIVCRNCIYGSKKIRNRWR